MKSTLSKPTSRLCVSLTIFTLLLLNLSAVAQTEFKVTSIGIRQADNSVVAMDSYKGKAEQHSSGALRMMAGSFKSKAFVAVPGVAAAVRIAPSGRQVFVLGLSFAVPDGMPQNQLVGLANLQPLKVEKGHREYVVLDMHSNVIKSKADFGAGGAQGIHLTFRPNGKEIEVEPQERLAPGEYAFVYHESDGYEMFTRMFCFGVD